MKLAYTASILALATALCLPAVHYVSLPGYAFKTDPKCQRTVAKTQFDRKCDWPRLGIKDLTAPPPITFGI
nr:hypothetical protein [Rhizobium sp. BK176]